MQRRDSNPQPLEHELSPITTRQGLPRIGKRFVPNFEMKKAEIFERVDVLVVV